MPTVEEALRYVALPRRDPHPSQGSALEKIASAETTRPVGEKNAHDLFIPMGSVGLDDLKVVYDGKNGLLSIEKQEKGQRSNDFFSLPSDGRYEIQARYDQIKQGLAIHYEARDYQNDIARAKVDFTNRVDKFLEVFQANVFPGLRGFTYLGMGKMWRRDIDPEPELVDVHEAIHTPDEYETRILTTWMLDRKLPRYKNT